MCFMANVRLKYVTIDRSEGLVRYYLRMPGQKKFRLPGKLGDPEFMAAYQAAISSRATPRPDGTLPKAQSTGTMGWLVDEYLKSAAFKGLATATQGARHNILKVMLKTAAGERISAITQPVIIAARDRRAETPAAANTFLKAMSHLFEYAIEYKHAPKNPTIGVKRLALKNKGGHHTWTDVEINRFLDRYPLGTTAHLCMTVMLYTGARVSDASRMGRQHISNGWLSFRAKKNDFFVEMPVAPELQQAIDACRPSGKGHLHFIINEWDKPFSEKGLGQRMRKWCDAIGLNHCSSHGLRKAGATFAADNGATENELMATFGWTSSKQAQLYTKKANRKRLATSGAAKISFQRTENGNEIVPPAEGVEVERDNPPKKHKEISA